MIRNRFLAVAALAAVAWAAESAQAQVGFSIGVGRPNYGYSNYGGRSFISGNIGYGGYGGYSQPSYRSSYVQPYRNYAPVQQYYAPVQQYYSPVYRSAPISYGGHCGY